MSAYDLKLTRCPGCGALLPDIEGPVHRYVGASVACWAVHGELLARRYEDARFADVGLLFTNSYMVQHPGTPSPQSIQSVAVHLIGLYLVLERGVDDSRLIQVLRGAADGSAGFHWLEPPLVDYAVTGLDLRATPDPADAQLLLRQMAESTRDAWAVHQPQIRQWAADLQLG